MDLKSSKKIIKKAEYAWWSISARECSVHRLNLYSMVWLFKLQCYLLTYPYFYLLFLGELFYCHLNSTTVVSLLTFPLTQLQLLLFSIPPEISPLSVVNDQVALFLCFSNLLSMPTCSSELLFLLAIQALPTQLSLCCQFYLVNVVLELQHCFYQQLVFQVIFHLDFFPSPCLFQHLLHLWRKHSSWIWMQDWS